ncbi:hypothetical protein HBI25_045540 [Parastagonospora nodorum]|nr:hypothetical protein HBH51_048140 [Parastagonospora nodorum]KAH4055690.1 hypothetical protein HBH49_062340 [Parastagonospora nodorum]KAH4072117.1 hypothetical protein HBH50_072770 [Parastagonospora nodorum]KAH4095001.1 hypothetical protein HBH48_061030 [Parastagonospora nodorum]KAH4230339.1 hypothetical protein HBI06_086000 [Parastagonospora nodorum]
MAPILRNLPSRQNRGGSLRQQAKNNAISHVSKGWPQKAIGRQTRGLSRPRLECYRREMVKAYLHCPRILNWINTHQTLRYRCAYHHDRRHVPARRCPSCAFKKLADVYWDKESTQADIDNKVNELDEAAFWDRLPFPWWSGTHTMEDPSQYAEHLVNAFVGSNVAGPNLQAWTDEADAIFFLDLAYTDTCATDGCSRVTTPAIGANSLFQISLPETGTIDLDQAINDTMSDTTEKNCDNCSPAASVMHNRVAQIEAAPQVLTMQLRLHQNVLTKKKDKKGKPIARLFKVDTVVNLRKTLDLTRHQTNKSVPLKYRLQAVISHSGTTLNAGHYMGQVRTSNRTYKTNDRRVTQTAPSILTEWPQQWPGRTMDDVRRKIPATRKRSEEFTPYVLTWVMTSGN